MDLDDARFWSAETQEVVRMLATRAVEVLGFTYSGAANLFKVHEDTIGRWYRSWAKSGITALARKVRGRLPGDHMRLSDPQQERIKRLVLGNAPDQLLLPFCLWTREAVAELIYNECHVVLSLQAVGEYLKRWEMTYQRPIMRAYEQDEEAARHWVEIGYPELVVRADEANGVILFEDETGFRSDTNKGGSYGLRGKTPVLRRTGKRFSANVVIAFGSNGEYYSSVLEANFNSETFIDFLGQLLLERPDRRKVFLVVDGHPSHRSKMVAAWVHERRERIELVSLPSYSPELNPVESGNNDAKYQVHSRNRPRTKPELIAAINCYLQECARRPDLVQRFFDEEHVRYARQTVGSI